MSDSSEVDPERLRTELDQIKEAMGLRERYPSQFQYWLLFSPIVGLTGVAYLVVGETLRAYRVRRRDRMAFYIGGAWMLVLAVLLVQVEFLHTWGYAAFGIAYGTHALGSYLALR